MEKFLYSTSYFPIKVFPDRGTFELDKPIEIIKSLDFLSSYCKYLIVDFNKGRFRIDIITYMTNLKIKKIIAKNKYMLLNFSKYSRKYNEFGISISDLPKLWSFPIQLQTASMCKYICYIGKRYFSIKSDDCSRWAEYGIGVD